MVVLSSNSREGDSYKCVSGILQPHYFLHKPQNTPASLLCMLFLSSEMTSLPGQSQTLCPFSKIHFKCHFDPPHHFTLSHT